MTSRFLRTKKQRSVAAVFASVELLSGLFALDPDVFTVQLSFAERLFRLSVLLWIVVGIVALAVAGFWWVERGDES